METIRVGLNSHSANNWTLYIAQEKGFFKSKGLKVEATVTPGTSQDQLKMLTNGAYHIAHQAADHFILGLERGMGDYVIFMTNSRPIMEFMTIKEICVFNDLKGKTIGIDRPETGFWLMFQKIFMKNGVLPKDYRILAHIGQTAERYAALKEGKIQATFLSPPTSLEAIAQGFPKLTSLATNFPDFSGNSGATLRSWARHNEATIVRYIQAFIKAGSWLSDPKNREEAIAIFNKRVKVNEQILGATYDTFVHEGLVKDVHASSNGIKQNLDIMVETGLLIAPAPPPEKYADPSYQQKALAGM